MNTEVFICMHTGQPEENIIMTVFCPLSQHAVLEGEATQIRASILDMAHCIRTFTEEVSEYSRKLVGIVQQIEGGEQIVEDGVGMAHTEHVSAAPHPGPTLEEVVSFVYLKPCYVNFFLMNTFCPICTVENVNTI